MGCLFTRPTLTRRLVSVLAASICGASTCAVAAAAPLRFAPPRPVTAARPLAAFASTSVSCPTVNRCVVGDDTGRVAVLARSGAAVTPLSLVTISGASGIDQLVCPSVRLCVGADSNGDVVASTAPTADAPTWRLTSLGTEFSFSCPTATECVGVDGAGGVVTSNHPGGGAGAWVASTAPEPLARIACPSASLCIALDILGNVFVLTNPQGGGAIWIPTGAPSLGPQYGGLVCPTVAECVASGVAGTVAVSTDPAGSGPWVVGDVDGTHWLLSIACARAGLCAAGDTEGTVVATTNAAAGLWSPLRVDPGRQITAISCPGRNVCVGADGGPDALVGSGPRTWTRSDFGEADPLTGIACASATLCVARDVLGHTFSSRDPANGRLWRRTSDARVTPRRARIACRAKLMCVALAKATGALRISIHGRRGPFRRVRIDDVPLTAIACPSTSLCVAVDAAGRAVVGT